MLALNYRDSAPIHSQIRDGLRKLIVTGALAPGEKLPSIRAMSMDLVINPNTIRRAYTDLEREGMIHSVPGEGSFAGGGAPAPDSPLREELMAQLRDAAAQLRELNVSDEELMRAIEEVAGE